jgi:hypothetical protein
MTPDPQNPELLKAKEKKRETLRSSKAQFLDI